jgi:translation initiation factor IF-2
VPVKVFELAKELSVTNSDLVARLDKLGFGKLAPSSDLDDVTAQKVRAAVTAPAASAAAGSAIALPDSLTVKDLGEKLGVGSGEVQKVLMGFGVLAGLNQRLDSGAMVKIAKKLGKNVTIGAAAPTPAPVSATPPTPASATRPAQTAAPVSKPTSVRPPVARTPARTAIAGGAVAGDLMPRPPVVTIMGHVDHGKTTLLDTIRKANVTSGEAGGITQHIGAYQIEHGGKRVTFLDTPGHAAFSSMRKRGASVTDIVVLVVAADDSVMPQTEEAIAITKEAGVPMIVAVNKIDKEDANPDRVLTDLASRYDVIPEAYGGTVQCVNISAKAGTGISDLLDTILLVAEVEVDPKADPNTKPEGTIIEAKLDKGRGAVATVLVQQGTLRKGDVVVAGKVFGKIRIMTDDKTEQQVKAGPSSPVEIIGLGGVPEAGDKLEVVKDEKEARSLAAQREQERREARLDTRGTQTLEDLYRTIRVGKVKELNVVVKADVQGSVQAISDNIKDLGNDEVRVRLLRSEVGPISESDVLLVSSDREQTEKNSLIIGFNVGMAGAVEKKAEKEHVQIQTFSIIYQLIDAVKDAMLALLPPIFEEHVIGHVTVRQKFKLPGGRAIAGSYVDDGVVKRNARVRVFRGKDLIHEGAIEALKRFKEDAREVAEGYECGILVSNFNDIQEIDGKIEPNLTFEVYELREVKREL